MKRTLIPNYEKGIVHPKMKILSLFPHPHVVPNLYECLCSVEHRGRYFEEFSGEKKVKKKSKVPQN